MLTMLDYALSYARGRLAVFPLSERGKTPATKKGYLDASTNPDKIKNWWGQNPNYNIGIATGEKSGGLVVIDLDIDENKGISGYEELCEWEREHDTLPETWISITGRGGYHYFYKSNEKYTCKVSLYDGIDIRADGGYIVAPPSIHPNGNTYRWECHPRDYPLAQVNDLVKDFLSPPREEQQEGFKTPDKIPDGERNSTLYKAACSMVAKGYPDSAIKAAIEATNNDCCVPPLDDTEVDNIIKSALKYDRGTAPYKAVCDNGRARPVNEKKKAKLTCLSDIQTEETQWIYNPYIPRGKIVIVGAYPGVGKTYLMCKLAACVSSGKPWLGVPKESPFTEKPGKVIYLTAEDGIADTIAVRMRACNADTNNIFVIEEGTSLSFDSPDIEDYIKEEQPEIVIFDPFQSFVGSGVNMNAANETREKLNPLIKLAKEYGTTFIIICHFNKNMKGDAITRILGSTDIVGACRSYLALGNVPGEPGVKYMAHEKSSLAKKGETVLFEIDPEEGGIKVVGRSDLSADDYTAMANKKKPGSHTLDEAKDFIARNLSEGERKASEMMELMKANGFSEITIRRAKADLGVKSRREGFGKNSVYYWSYSAEV